MFYPKYKIMALEKKSVKALGWVQQKKPPPAGDGSNASFMFILLVLSP
jgi:hypothetical protein